MRRHTPGPWRVDPRAANHVIAETRPICSIGYFNNTLPDNGRGANEANAHLIAAAPDLLEALKDATQHCAWCDGTGKEYTHEDEAAVGCSPGSSEIPCSHCKDWRKVLAKAEET